jgi:queuine/archaeosine tRNA-ribosyltransferase
LNNILVTPLFIQEDSLDLIRRIKHQQGTTVMFDSGGYYVQIGRLSYEELYYPLLQFYKSNRWADIYTLPDYVPTSQDTIGEIQAKVNDTVRYTTLFFQELPSDLQKRAMPVVQGHTIEQIDYCLKHYLPLGIQYLGFGSFGTVGRNSQVNIATYSAVDLAKYVVEIAQQNQIQVHLFGLGTPALVAMIKGIGASSFDSSSWIKSAGFGQVHLPFTRGYNISHRNGRSELQKGITIQEFKALRARTQHTCPFCRSIEELQQEKMYRALHNLMSVCQSVEMINQRKYELIRSIYENGSPRYRKEYQKWLAG